MFVFINPVKLQIFMSGLTKKFDRYAVTYNATKPTVTGKFIAEIGCLSDSTPIAWIYFYPDGDSIPSNTVNSSGMIQLYYEIKRFNDIITILRYETPLTLWVDPVTGGGGLISGASELIGQQEGV
jgi:hypothetical protein